MQGSNGIEAIANRVDHQIEVSERAVQRQKLSLVLEIEKKAQIANAVCWLILHRNRLPFRSPKTNSSSL